jgi:hypothetical protein
VGDDARVRESEIGWVSELQGVTAVLLEHWIAGGRRRGRLTMVARGCGGGPVRCGGRKRKWQWKCSHVKARGNAWEAPGYAQGREEGVVTWEQELAAGGSRGGSGDGGATWRGRSRPARGQEAAARVLGRHVARLRAARGWPVRGTWPAKWRGRARAETEEERGWR